MRINDTWRTYRGGKCLCFNHKEIISRLPREKSPLDIGHLVLVYQRRKEKPQMDKVWTGVVTDVKSSQRKERRMTKVYRCSIADLTEASHKDIVYNVKGNWVRQAFLLPYSPELYERILKWIWQVRYLLCEKVYELFPIDFEKNENILESLQDVDAEQFKKDAIRAVGFPIDHPTDRDIKQCYRTIDYKRLQNV